jgi:hypothetical protein
MYPLHNKTHTYIRDGKREMSTGKNNREKIRRKEKRKTSGR